MSVPGMRVIATAGHVDHGKSTLVRALTGTDPDRWAAEKSRGLTIDLGYAHTTLPSGEVLALVDVPGHQRFIANMLAGLGPAPAVLLVVAADEGWGAQSSEHLAAIDALGLIHGLLVITRCDLADPGAALTEAREHLHGTTLAQCPAVTVSAATGAGLEQLRTALDELIARLPAPDTGGPARLWVDRAFTLRGAGTIITGTLAAGSLHTDQKVTVAGHEVTVRRLQGLGADVPAATAVARVAVNLRGLPLEAVRRGDTLLTGEWWHTRSADVRVPEDADLPERLMMHVGTAATEARVRPLGVAALRLTWAEPLPMQTGDRLVLRDPGRQAVLCGAVVLDADPPALHRRGAAQAWAERLRNAPERIDVAREVARRGHVDVATLRRLGVRGQPTGDLIRTGDLLVDPEQWERWTIRLREVVEAYATAHPLQARMPMPAAAEAAGLPQPVLVEPLARAAGLSVAGGHLAPRGVVAHLGAAEAGVRTLERGWTDHPFRAPERAELAALGLGVPEIAAAARLARLLDLGDQIVLAPQSPALALHELARLPQPFTTSQARQALNSTRRVAIPLLEYLDRRGWTRRIDGSRREVVSPGPSSTQ